MDRENTKLLIDAYIGRLLNESTPLRPIWNQELVLAGGGYSWSYVNALFLAALLKLYRSQGEEKYLDFTDRFMDEYVQEDGSILTFSKEEYNIDSVCGGTVLLDLYELTGKDKYRMAAEKLADQLLSHPRTGESSFWHKKIYPDQVWLDGLYMAQPFYMRYGAEHDMGFCADSFRQFMTVAEKMKDPDTGLYYHGWDSSRQAFWCDPESGLSRSFWLRSIGWFCMACVDTLEVMPVQMKEEKQNLRAVFRDLAESLLPYQDKGSHMWYQVVDQGSREGNYLETSGSSMIAYSFLKGASLGYLEAGYKELGEQIFDGICAEMLCEKNGELLLGGICLVAGLGGKGRRRDGSYAYYISEPVAENDGKGVGPFLLAYGEL